jgi:hypothetical protein
MKLILHIGMPKAGSSALQNSLLAAGTELRRHGILYPAGGKLPKNHNMLVCGFLEAQKLPRIFRQIYTGDRSRMKRDFADFMQKLENAVQTSRPNMLVLSSEMLWSKSLGPKRAQTLKTVLAPLSEDMRVVAYVRSPAQFYLSLVQQVLKASSRISPPRPMAYRRILDSYTRLTEDIHVIAYERSELYGADITRDFLHRFAPDAVLAPDTTRQANQTLSAEGMDILHRYRQRNHADSDGIFTTDTGALIGAIGAAEDAAGGWRRPVMHENVRDFVNGASVDLLWLRDAHGIVFSDVDYDRISDGVSPPPSLPAQTVADICTLDEARRDRMLAAILESLGEAGIPHAPGSAQPDEMIVAITRHLRERTGALATVRFKTAVNRRKRRVGI